MSERPVAYQRDPLPPFAANPADDALAAAAREGDATAFDALAGNALPAIFDLCASVVGGERARESALAVLSEARDHLNETADREFGPWLAGVALRVLARAPRTPGDADSADLRERARARLTARQHALLHLHLRYGLSAEAVAAALGVHLASAQLVLERVRVAALALTPDGNVDILAQYGDIPAIEPPPGMAEPLLAELRGGWRAPSSTTHDTPVAPFVPTAEWVEPPPPVRRRTWPVAPIIALLAGLFSVALLLPESPVALTRATPRRVAPAVVLDATPQPLSPHPTATASRPSPTATATATTEPRTEALEVLGDTATPTPTPTESPTPTATPTVSETATATPPSATATPNATPTETATPPTATATPTSCTPQLSASTYRLTLPSSGQSSFKLLNGSCATASFNATAVSGGEWLSFAPAAATIAPWDDVVIELVANDTIAPGEHSAEILVSGPAGQAFVVRISYTVADS